MLLSVYLCVCRGECSSRQKERRGRGRGRDGPLGAAAAAPATATAVTAAHGRSFGTHGPPLPPPLAPPLWPRIPASNPPFPPSERHLLPLKFACLNVPDKDASSCSKWDAAAHSDCGSASRLSHCQLPCGPESFDRGAVSLMPARSQLAEYRVLEYPAPQTPSPLCLFVSKLWPLLCKDPPSASIALVSRLRTGARISIRL